MRLIGTSFLEVAGEAKRERGRGRKRNARPAISVLRWPQKAYGRSLPIDDLRLLFAANVG